MGCLLLILVAVEAHQRHQAEAACLALAWRRKPSPAPRQEAAELVNPHQCDARHRASHEQYTRPTMVMIHPMRHNIRQDDALSAYPSIYHTAYTFTIDS